MAKVAKRVDDDDVMHLLKVMLKANGHYGVPQGGVVSPLLSKIYLNEMDRMLERAKEATRYDKYTYIEYARLSAPPDPGSQESIWPARTPGVAFPSCKHERTIPRNAKTSQPSP